MNHRIMSEQMELKKLKKLYIIFLVFLTQVLISEETKYLNKNEILFGNSERIDKKKKFLLTTLTKRLYIKNW